MDELIYNIENELLNNIKIESESPYKITKEAVEDIDCRCIRFFKER